MCAQWIRAQYHRHATGTARSMRSTMQRQWLISSGIILTFAVLFLLSRVSPVQKIYGWATSPSPNLPSLDIYKNEPDQPGFFDWQTRSAFDPVRVEDAENKSVEDLCASFPEHLLAEIQPVLKTGHGVVDARVRPQLQSVSACLSNLLIFSDTDEYYEGHDMIDVLADIPTPMAKKAEDLEAWRNGSLADGTALRQAGWKADKFKFILGATRAWRMRPGRKWYVFYEADTYIVWDNLFRMLANFDPNEPYYFGSPTFGRDGTWFANGGPGYILSREAMRRLTRHDFDQKTGHYTGPAMLRKWWDLICDDCCGDSVLGFILWHENVTLGGLWPMFNPHPPHGVPFSDRLWCQPLVTMHKPSEEDIMGIWRWQWENRVADVSSYILGPAELAAELTDFAFAAPSPLPRPRNIILQHVRPPNARRLGWSRVGQFLCTHR